MLHSITDNYIETYTGIKFNFLDPQPEQISIEDIAHSLSMQVRYTGHCNKFYSIAEHSLLVADLCPEHELQALMHDASEAYLTDIASPIKPFLQNYKMMECKVMGAINRKFGIDEFIADGVHHADVQALRIESKQLMHSKGIGWAVNNIVTSPIPDIEIQSLVPEEAKKRFLERFHKLYSGDE